MSSSVQSPHPRPRHPPPAPRSAGGECEQLTGRVASTAAWQQLMGSTFNLKSISSRHQASPGPSDTTVLYCTVLKRRPIILCWPIQNSSARSLALLNLSVIFMHHQKMFSWIFQENFARCLTTIIGGATARPLGLFRTRAMISLVYAVILCIPNIGLSCLKGLCLKYSS